MNKIRHTVLGLFLFASLALLGVVTIVLGNFGGETVHHDFYFDNVDGLEEGNPVTVYGVKLGKVESIAFTAGAEKVHGRLKVSLSLSEDVDLGEDIVVRITSQSLLGGKRIEIETAAETDTPPEDEGPHSEVDRGFARAISGLVDENRDSLRSMLASLRLISDSAASGSLATR